MSRRSITHACGHVLEWDLRGSNATRDRRAEAIGARLCDDCWRAQQLAESKASAAAATQQIEGLWELPPLEGSAKQIAWATDLRAQTLGKLDTFLKGLEPFEQVMLLGLIQDLLARPTTTSARLWIDWRQQQEHLARSIALAAVLAQIESAADVRIELDGDSERVWVKGLIYDASRLRGESTRAIRELIGARQLDVVYDVELAFQDHREEEKSP